MTRNWKTLALLVVAAAAAGCVAHAPRGLAHGPGGVPYSTRDAATGVGATGVGATGGSAGGALSGSGAGVESQVEKKEQRGNTPPGMDRDGHGPAAGAIVDPTGAATRGKPY